MRVIGGRYRGRRLARPPADVRATTDRLRESLFNVLGEKVVDSSWLELFAGSGAVGLEALSRGARQVVFNDKSSKATGLIRRNLETCGLERGFEIFESDAFTLLNRLLDRRFDYIFLDPPYRFPRVPQLLEKVGHRLDFSNQPLLMLECFKKTPLPALVGWRLLRTLRAGDSHLKFLQKDYTT